MNTTENNKLIAEFMGRCGKRDTTLWTFKGIDYILLEGDIWYRLSEAKFNSSWDWLMRVVEKIESLLYYTEINKKIAGYHYVHITNSDGFGVHVFGSNLTKIGAVYTAVVKFITWYNENK